MTGVFDEEQLSGLADWRTAVLAGAPVAELLKARLDRVLRDSPAEVWIYRIGADVLARRMSELEALSASTASRVELLNAFPLFGVPFAVKDNIDVAGIPTTAACPAFARLPNTSASAVQRLLDVGAVLIGKTNLDQFATGLVGARSPFGAPSSALSSEHISGGSSSGSAVAVSRGDVAFALGTDTAGSGRIPAGFNNIVGLKPTPGRVSTAGVLPACRTLDCVSVFALSVADAAAVLSVIEGPDPLDDYSNFLPGRARWQRTPRVAVPALAALFPHEPAYERAWADAVARVSAWTGSVSHRGFDDVFAVADLLYQGPWVAERYAVIDELLRTQPDSLDPTVSAVIRKAEQFDAVDGFKAQYTLASARRRLAALWDDFDILMVPTAPRHPTHAALAADPIGVNSQLGAFTNFVNLLGWCAISLPATILADGRPFGVTFIARGGDDAALASWASQWEQSSGIAAGAAGSRSRAADSRLPVADSRVPDLPRPASEPTLPIAAVGAHLSGLPLNWQLVERRAVLKRSTRTAPCYRLYALPGTQPPRPGMLRVAEGGASIELEIWDVPLSEVGSFLALIPSPLGLGSIELADGSRVHGFVCEAAALGGAIDISAVGGWRADLASLGQSKTPSGDRLPAQVSLTSSPAP
ncbi:MAG: allophanate hydrolase [Betaproteobacteria bacterium]